MRDRSKDIDPETNLRRLSARQLRFIEEYLVDTNATRAAMAAGYAESGISAVGYRLLRSPSVRAELAKRRANRSHKLDISAERVLLEYMRIAFLDPAILFDDETGEIKPVNEQPEDVRRAIKEMTFETDKDGNPRITVKLSDKQRALDALAKHLGLFEADNTQRIDPEKREYSEIEIARRIAYMLHRGGKALEAQQRQTLEAEVMNATSEVQASVGG